MKPMFENINKEATIIIPYKDYYSWLSYSKATVIFLKGDGERVRVTYKSKEK